MALAKGYKADFTQKYWVASLAWKNRGDWAEGWTYEDIIQECRLLCTDQGRIGFLADNMLEDIIHDRRSSHREASAQVVYICDSLTAVYSAVSFTRDNFSSGVV